MKNILTFLLTMLGFLSSGCSEFEVVRFKNHDFESFFKSYDITSPNLQKYMIGDVLVVPYLSQSLNDGYYDLRVSVWSKNQNQSIVLPEASIISMGINSQFEIEVTTRDKRSNSDLYVGHLPVIESIKETVFGELDNPEVVVSLKIRKEDQEVVVNFPFKIVVERIGAPLR